MEYVKSIKTFRLQLSDGAEFSDQVMMYANLAKNAEELTEQTYPLIEIFEYDLLNKKHVAIVAYTFIRLFYF